MPSAGGSRVGRWFRLMAWSAGLVLWLCAVLLVPAQAQGVAGVPATIVLHDDLPTQDAVSHTVWVDESGGAALEQVQALPPARFKVEEADKVYRLGQKCSLWMHLRLARPAEGRRDWRLALPLPLLDEVTVYQLGTGGRWQPQQAGDRVANALWPEAGRYPVFRLDIPPGQTRDVWVRVRHVSPLSVPLRLTSESDHDARMQMEYMALGAIFGAMLLLLVACCAQALVYREPAYGWYAAYALIMSLAIAAYTGVAGHLIWHDWPYWADSAQGSLALLACGAALLFVRHLCGISARYARFERVVLLAGVLGLFSGVLYLWVPRETWGMGLLGGTMTLTVVLGMVTAGLTWLRGDPVGRWVMLAYAPMALSALAAVLRIWGLLPANWLTQYAVIASMALEVPLLLVALSIRLRERHSAETRAHALSSQDALTGLLAEHLFRDRLRQVILRARRNAEPAAIVFVDLVNYGSIRRHYGTAVAEQSLLRTVIKLRRVLRDVDTTSRVGEARFGLILEGVGSRSSVTNRAAQLIASGLMPLKGLQPEVTLQFHVAAAMLNERLEEAPELLDALAEVLSNMSPRTRRPIRFVEPELTQPMPLDMDSIDPNSSPPASQSGH